MARRVAIGDCTGPILRNAHVEFECCRTGIPQDQLVNNWEPVMQRWHCRLLFRDLRNHRVVLSAEDTLGKSFETPWTYFCDDIIRREPSAPQTLWQRQQAKRRNCNSNGWSKTEANEVRSA